MIRRLHAGRYRLSSRKKNPKTGRRRNLGTFRSRAAALRHERVVQMFQAPRRLSPADPARHAFQGSKHRAGRRGRCVFP